MRYLRVESEGLHPGRAPRSKLYCCGVMVTKRTRLRDKALGERSLATSTRYRRYTPLLLLFTCRVVCIAQRTYVPETPPERMPAQSKLTVQVVVHIRYCTSTVTTLSTLQRSETYERPETAPSQPLIDACWGQPPASYWDLQHVQCPPPAPVASPPPRPKSDPRLR